MKITEPGTYKATATAVEFAENSNGTPFLRITYTVDDKSIDGQHYLSDAAFPNTLKSLEEAFSFSGNFETIENELVNKPCQITVENEEYDGKVYTKVKWLNHVDGKRAAALDQSKKQSLINKLNLAAKRQQSQAEKSDKAF